MRTWAAKVLYYTGSLTDQQSSRPKLDYRRG